MPSLARADAAYLKCLGQAVGGALLFALPPLMTMEVWWLGGFAMDRGRLLIFLLASLPLMVGLSYFVGFEPAHTLKDDILDALAAFAVGFALSAALLAILGVLRADLTLSDLVGKIVLSAIPASIGALLAGKQLGGPLNNDQIKRRAGPLGALFLMGVGAIFLAFNIAPTEEIFLISYMMGPAQALLLVALSLLALHMFVYALGFPGEARRREAGGRLRTFMTFTIPGYAVALSISAFCLWAFGRFEGVAPHEQATMTAVLGFPAALGAATARLVT